MASTQEIIDSFAAAGNVTTAVAYALEAQKVQWMPTGAPYLQLVFDMSR